MDKKDIYEHLAKIYLDASLNTKKESRKTKKNPAMPLVISGIAILFIAGFMLNSLPLTKHPKNAEIALMINSDPVKINFNFNPAKKEIYSLNLNNLNMLNFRALDFMVKKTDPLNGISLRVEFTNIYNERSELYFKDIPHRWFNYHVALSDFKNLSDWSCMRTLAFIVEEWNVKEKNGVVYIDNVRFLR